VSHSDVRPVEDDKWRAMCNHAPRQVAMLGQQLSRREAPMYRSATIIAILLMTRLAWAQEGNVESPVPPNFRFPVGAEITFQWNYTCRVGNKPCVFSCGTADRVKALTIYLGTIPVGSYGRNSVIFYFYSTETIPYSGGFRINGGPASNLSCDVTGMTLDYAGPPMPQGDSPRH
jgi:hypothetical protein